MARGSPHVTPRSGTKIVIIGGVAGGATAAARLRRLDENCQIVMFERGPYVSFANCGLPYYVGGIIEKADDLLVTTPMRLVHRYNVDVRIQTEVIGIDATNKTVKAKHISSGEMYEETYDYVLLSPGAEPIRPPLPGIDLGGVFSVRSIPDVQRIVSWCKDPSRAERLKKGTAVVVGGGFIGLEMAENLDHLGMKVVVVEMLPQLMPPLDYEMAVTVQEHVIRRGVELCLGDGVAGFEQIDNTDRLTVKTSSGRAIPCDLAILSIGVKPESKLAQMAGLKLGFRGSIITDERMRTSDPSIYAVGDAVQIKDFVLKVDTLVPLAGPANRQARVAADNMMGRTESTYRGCQGTAVCGVFGWTLAMTGATQKTLDRHNYGSYGCVYAHPLNHVGYYPGAKSVHIKLVFDTKTRKVLGAQACGVSGVEKRIDVLSTYIQMGATVDDLAEAELCYAPQYGAARDPINHIGMIAQNFLEGDYAPQSTPETLKEGIILDVRSDKEIDKTHEKIEHSIRVPLDFLRAKIDELPKGTPIHTVCRAGQRAYVACRILRQLGYNASYVNGGWHTWKVLNLPLDKLCERPEAPDDDESFPKSWGADIELSGKDCHDMVYRRIW